MKNFLPPSIQRVIDEFSRLPGIGPKSAQRLAMHLLYSPESRIRQLGDAVVGLKEGLQFCQKCWNIAEAEICRVCDDPGRGQRQICVVEEVLDVLALEKTGEYQGVYHVLHGVLSPVDGIGPEQLKIQELVGRVKDLLNEDTAIGETEIVVSGQPNSNAVELILATNPSMEGETTAMYLLRLFKSMNVKVTRIARGLPAGGDLDYADDMTLTRALQGRAEYR